MTDRDLLAEARETLLRNRAWMSPGGADKLSPAGAAANLAAYREAKLATDSTLTKIDAALAQPATERVCAGSGHPCILMPMATSIPGTLECGICGQQVRYDGNGWAVTHAALAQPAQTTAAPEDCYDARELAQAIRVLAQRAPREKP